ncbi:hypothetical protein FOA52_013227 [Chlamydomonas sp. UWO 241]|nr:hypothetical protein FOA52_013227 [Chlamydomonas sp. UWO 241]
MRTRTAARLASEAAAALQTASAREVLLSEDLFGVLLWPFLNASTKAALRGVSRAMRRLVDGLVEVVTSPSAGFSAAQLTSALMRWRGVTDLTLRGVSNATSTLLPLTTATLPRLYSLTVRQVQSSAFIEWDMPMFSSDLAATLRVVDLSFCFGLRSIDAVRHCDHLRILWIPGLDASDLSPLAACSEMLEELWMAGCKYVNSLAPLKACIKLCKLDIRGCDFAPEDVEDLQPDEVEELQQTCTQLADPSSVELKGLVHELRPNIPRWHQTAAITVLRDMIDEEPDEAQAAIATADLILVLPLGGDSAPDVQATTSDALAYLATRSADIQSVIAAAGDIPRLVQLLQGLNSSADVQAAAAWALCDLAANHAENQDAFASGAIQRLVQLLGCDSVARVQAAAAGALCNLAANNADNLATIVAPGPIRSLVRLLGPDSSSDMQEAAADELGILAANRVKNKVKIAPAAGAIVPLVQLLGPVSSEDVQRAAAEALRDLAANDAKNTATIAAAGAIPTLVQLLGPESTADVQVAAAGALHNLACYIAYSNSIAAAGAIPALALLLVPESSADVHVAAAGALGNLAFEDAENQTAIVDAGAIPPLVQLFGPASSEVVHRAAADALGDLARYHAGNQAGITAAGGIPALHQLLGPGSLTDVQAAAAGALRELGVDNKRGQKKAGGKTKRGAAGKTK